MPATRRLALGNCFVLALVLTPWAGPVYAQRADENVVAEASDAFGTTVGRDTIGLYSSTSARGFNPSDSGNLRIEGLYFDQIQGAAPVNRIVRDSSVNVGISAQAYPFAAPTGVVDFHLRTPGDQAAGSGVVSVASYGQAYAEFDFQAPLASDTLSVGGGVGYARNTHPDLSQSAEEWTLGALARWQPTSWLRIVPFWGIREFTDSGGKSRVYLGNSGYPKFRNEDQPPQPWTDLGITDRTYGTIARLRPNPDWELALGVFRSEHLFAPAYVPLLFHTDALGRGEYIMSAAGASPNTSTSGELRLGRQFDRGNARHTLFASLRGRQREDVATGFRNIPIGPGSTDYVPIIEKPDVDLPDSTLIEASQYTPGLAYQGLWRDAGQLTVSVQKTFYDRTVTPPGGEPTSNSISTWLYNANAGVNLTKKVEIYASKTRGFEEVGLAPLNAANRGEVVAPQVAEQIDAGIRYELLSGLRLVAGIFEIEKGYYDLDETNVYRRVGMAKNRGVELSLAGNPTDQLTVVAGVVLIDATITYDDAAEGLPSRTAVGPVPGLVRANLQYSVPRFPGLVLDAQVEYTSKRYARAESIQLPAVATIDAGLRYQAKVLGRPGSLRLRFRNLTSEYGLTPESSGRIRAFAARRFDLSFTLDIW